MMLLMVTNFETIAICVFLLIMIFSDVRCHGDLVDKNTIGGDGGLDDDGELITTRQCSW